LLRASIPATIRIEEQIAAAPVVFANEGQLQQVLTNLVTNAAHAIGAEIGTIGIEIALGPRDGRGDPAIMARLSVTDSGPGMSETTLRRIFEPFYTTKAVGEGSGLGLAVVHGIVASHGGRVEVTSQLGKGTRFDILLPIIASDALSQPISPEKIAAVAE
jgi:signal transduction histidine kinase